MEDRELFILTFQIAEIALGYSTCERSLGDMRSQEVNPIYSQTSSGLFLELYHGIPGRLWTPWDLWTCWSGGSGNWQNIMSDLLKRLGATRTNLRSIHLDYGPVYSLTNVDGTNLPLAKVRHPDEYLNDQVMRIRWQSLMEEVDPLGTS